MLIGPRATASAKEVSSDVFHLGANSVDTGGIYLTGDRERLVKRAFMDGAAKVVLLVDNSKLTRSAPMRLADLAEIDVLVTSGPVPKGLVRACESDGVELIVAEPA